MFVHYKKEIAEKKLNRFKNEELNESLKKLKSVFVLNSGFDGNNNYCLISELSEAEKMKKYIIDNNNYIEIDNNGGFSCIVGNKAHNIYFQILHEMNYKMDDKKQLEILNKYNFEVIELKTA